MLSTMFYTHCKRNIFTFVGLVIVFESEACMQLVNVGTEGNLHQNIVFISFPNVLIEDFSLLYQGISIVLASGLLYWTSVGNSIKTAYCSILNYNVYYKSFSLQYSIKKTRVVFHANFVFIFLS